MKYLLLPRVSEFSPVALGASGSCRIHGPHAPAPRLRVHYVCDGARYRCPHDRRLPRIVIENRILGRAEQVRRSERSGFRLFARLPQVPRLLPLRRRVRRLDVQYRVVTDYAPLKNPAALPRPPSILSQLPPIFISGGGQAYRS
jgi:hypothetical protein